MEAFVYLITTTGYLGEGTLVIITKDNIIITCCFRMYKNKQKYEKYELCKQNFSTNGALTL